METNSDSAKLGYMEPFVTLNRYLEWNSHLSGWAQALGAVLSIWGAFALAARAERKRKADEAAATKEALAEADRSASKLANIAVRRLASIRMSLADTAFDQFNEASCSLLLRHIEADVETLRSFDYLQLSDQQRIHAFATLIGLLRAGADLIQFIPPLSARQRKNEAPGFRKSLGELCEQGQRMAAFVDRTAVPDQG